MIKKLVFLNKKKKKKKSDHFLSCSCQSLFLLFLTFFPFPLFRVAAAGATVAKDERTSFHTGQKEKKKRDWNLQKKKKTKSPLSSFVIFFVKGRECIRAKRQLMAFFLFFFFFFGMGQVKCRVNVACCVNLRVAWAVDGLWRRGGSDGEKEKSWKRQLVWCGKSSEDTVCEGRKRTYSFSPFPTLHR